MQHCILSGPPGSGKIIRAMKKAVSIVEPSFQCTNDNELKSKFDELKEGGKINFILFKESYSSEEYMKGLSNEGKRVIIIDEIPPSKEIKELIFNPNVHIVGICNVIH